MSYPFDHVDVDAPPFAERADFFYETASPCEVESFGGARHAARRELASGPLMPWTIHKIRQEIHLSADFGLSPWLLAYAEVIHQHDRGLWHRIASGGSAPHRLAQQATRALRSIRFARPRGTCPTVHRTVRRGPRARGFRARRRTSTS